MTLHPRFSVTLFALLLALHGIAVVAVLVAASSQPWLLVIMLGICASLHNVFQHYGPAGKWRWHCCQLGDSKSVLMADAGNCHRGPPKVSYFSEFLIVLYFESSNSQSSNSQSSTSQISKANTFEFNWRDCLGPKSSLIILPDSLSSAQQSQIRSYLRFRE